MGNEASISATVTLDPARWEDVAFLVASGGRLHRMAAPAVEFARQGLAHDRQERHARIAEVVEAAVDGGTMPADEAGAAAATLLMLADVTEYVLGGDNPELHVTADGAHVRLDVFGYAKVDGDVDDWVAAVRPVAEAGKVTFVEDADRQWVEALGQTPPVTRQTVDVPDGHRLLLVDDTVADLLALGPLSLVTGGADGLPVGQVTWQDLQ